MCESSFNTVFCKDCNAAARAKIACIDCIDNFVDQGIELWPSERSAPIAYTYICWVRRRKLTQHNCHDYLPFEETVAQASGVRRPASAIFNKSPTKKGVTP